MNSLFSAKGWTRVWVGALVSTAVCVLVALSVDLFNASAMSDEARLRSILTDIFLPIALAGPLSLFFLMKLRELAISNGHLQVTLNAMGQGLSGFDASYRLSIWNARYAELFGMDAQDLRAGRPFVELLERQRETGNFSGSAAALQDSIVQEYRNGVPFVNVTSRANGVVVRTVHMPAPDGGWIATHEDITGQHAQQELLELQNVRFSAVLNNMRQGVCMFDGDHKLVSANPPFLELYGVAETLVAPGATLSGLERAFESCGMVPKDASGRALHLSPIEEATEQVFELVDGRFVRVVGKPIHGGGWVSTHEDVTEQRRVEAQMAHDALHDALTGLPNRRFLEKELAAREVAYAKTCGGLALLHVDIDRFKQINDTLGHSAGDAILVHAAQVLKSSVRDTDFVARVGGDEFIIVSSFASRPNYLRGLARRVISRMSRPVRYEGRECRSGVSVGIAHHVGRDLDVKDLLVRADLALYRAKTAGRGRAEFFAEALQQRIIQTKTLADEIMFAVERDEFDVHFQAKVDAQNYYLTGLEALVRWNHPTRGILSPAQFLQTAEELGVVPAIDHMVLDKVIGAQGRWEREGIEVPRVSVNISSRRLHDPNLIRHIEQLNIVPSRLSFELLESIYLDGDDDMASFNIDRLREKGIQIDIDDFGTGHTSIVALLKVRPHRLKIDRQLIAPIGTSEAQRGLVGSIIEIGHSLGVSAVAEGVETLEQARILAELGCDELQGYAFSRPAGFEETTKFLLESRLKPARRA